MAYGTHAFFTVTLMESFVELNLTPFAGLIFQGEIICYGEAKCRKIEQIPHCAMPLRISPTKNTDMLIGEVQYAGLAVQIDCDPTVCAQKAVTGIKTLPNKGAGKQLSKVLQGSSEPYSGFVDCLLQLGSHILGDVDTVMIVIKQLAYENANKCCQLAVHPHRNRSLNDDIQLCRDIDGTHEMN